MSKRQPLSARTVASISAEIAGNPLSPERATAHAEAMEPILQLVEELRKLPLKDVEPAIIFRPERSTRDG